MSGEFLTNLASTASDHLESLCSAAPDRRPGSPGNRAAAAHVADTFTGLGWSVTLQDFDCLDWTTEGGSLVAGDQRIELTPSPYGLGVNAKGPLRVLANRADLDRRDLPGSIVVLTGDLAAEPLTPKAFPFYGSEGHSQMIAALEEANPVAVVAVTGLYPALCGALDPFPLIEDGDFSIPTANLRPQDAKPLLSRDGQPATIEIHAKRWPARASNVLAARGPQSDRITVMAHLDSKPGTPGAVDNAAGVVALLLLADLLARRDRLPVGVELLAINGEDHYAAPGEVAWLAAQTNQLDEVALAVNIDGAGYRVGRSAYSTYNLEGNLAAHIDAVFGNQPQLIRGPDWFQSDHAIFAMRGRPALAITSEQFDEMLGVLYHSPADTPAQVDVRRLVEIANALDQLIATWPG